MNTIRRWLSNLRTIIAQDDPRFPHREDYGSQEDYEHAIRTRYYHELDDGPYGFL